MNYHKVDACVLSTQAEVKKILTDSNTDDHSEKCEIVLTVSQMTAFVSVDNFSLGERTRLICLL